MSPPAPPATRISLAAALVLALLAIVALPAETRAQAAPRGESLSGEPTGPLALRVAELGLGGRPVANRWNPIRVVFAWAEDAPIEVLLRVAITDGDGDTTNYERVVAATPGLELSAWLYAMLPHRFDGITVSAFRAEEGAGGFVPGELLASVYEPASRPGEATAVRIGVIGRRTMGLTELTTRPPPTTSPSEGFNPLGHAAIDIVAQLTPEQIPDRWHGLMPIETLVFSGENPGGLRRAQADAIERWVRAGGHLIVVPPVFGEQWTTPAANPLHGLLPRVEIVRQEGVSYEPLRPLLTASAELPLETSGVRYVLGPLASAGPGEARVLATDPEGEPIVVTRTIGVGAVTLIGLDLASRWATTAGVPDADVFWNRVLGRRGAAATLEDLEQQSRATGINYSRAGIGYLDDMIPDEIAQQGTAAQGVLLGFVLFVVYWLIAGPLGFAFLRRIGLDRHAWLAFAASAGFFTLLAWGGAAWLRPGSIGGSHYSIVTGVYGENDVRARSFISLLIPRYGTARIEADTESAALAPWRPRVGRPASFPDTRGYRIDAADPTTAAVPARQTVKQFRIDQIGPSPWASLPRPVPDAEPALSDRPGSGPFELTGSLRHGLPGALENIVIIVNRGAAPIGRELASGRSGDLIASAADFALPSTFVWDADTDLDLGSVTAVDPSRRSISLGPWLRALTPRGQTNALSAVTEVSINLSVPRRGMALLMYDHLAPPTLRQGQPAQEIVALRSDAAGLDLSRWLTEPCVILIGTVETEGPEPVPTPFEADGQEVELEGQTLIGWVYPLPANPPAYVGAGGPGDIIESVSEADPEG